MAGFLLPGLLAGSVGKCASNPCFNGGVCRELYSRYVCDCAYTSHRGWNCGRGRSFVCITSSHHVVMAECCFLVLLRLLDSQDVVHSAFSIVVMLGRMQSSRSISTTVNMIAVVC